MNTEQKTFSRTRIQFKKCLSEIDTGTQRGRQKYCYDFSILLLQGKEKPFSCLEHTDQQTTRRNRVFRFWALSHAIKFRLLLQGTYALLYIKRRHCLSLCLCSVIELPSCARKYHPNMDKSAAAVGRTRCKQWRAVSTSFVTKITHKHLCQYFQKHSI